MTRRRDMHEKIAFFEDDGHAVPSVGAVFDNAAVSSSTFVNNKSVPVHRWLRYSAGYSADWVRDCIVSVKSNQACDRLFISSVFNPWPNFSFRPTNVRSISKARESQE